MENNSLNSVEWAIYMLNDAETAEEVYTILRCSVRAAVRAQGATIVLLEDGQCHYTDEDAMSPLWKGQRFPATSCISGWAMLHDQVVAIPDISIDSRVPQAAYRPTFVRSLLMVPIRVADTPVGAIGAYWADLHQASTNEIDALKVLADAAGCALARVSLPAGVGRMPAMTGKHMA
ncbi:GAF domain-containing protein [Catellatospora tritici]|uniref:GAF domain-containing protein n=1 Tax=Catellatospora tritici TaxID=2851566 RepID=UPI001C2D12E6|nr:GAF domain-containing protein [Catellatospora tritici]MBV1856414.1 GAF domain-containing protein [Catellatospora tritici]